MDKLGKITFKQLNEMIVYGKDNHDNFVYIDDCENGLECNLVCDYCRGRLNARNGGDVKAHHFAHQAGSNCRKGHEQTVALMTNQILSGKKQIFLPSWGIQFKGESLQAGSTEKILDISLKRYSDDELYFVDIKTEHYNSIAILMHFSNRVDQFNSRLVKEKISKEYDYAVEVDLSYFFGTNEIVIDTLESILLRKSHFKTWFKNKEEAALVDKINSVGFRYVVGTYGYFNKETIYCPKYKKTIYDNQCNSCSYLINNIVRDYRYKGLNSYKCLGFIDIINKETISNAEPYIVSEEELKSKEQVKTSEDNKPFYQSKQSFQPVKNIQGIESKIIDNKECFDLEDIPKRYNKRRFIIYNVKLNVRFKIDFDLPKDYGWYDGYQIFNGVASSQLSKLPLTHRLYWAVEKIL